MDWMYKKSKPEDEEYLLGRRIDKHVEEEAEPKEDNPGLEMHGSVQGGRHMGVSQYM